MSDHDEILVALRRITRAIDLQSKRLVKATGLTAPQLVVIDTLRKQGNLSPSAIARAVSLSQATITSILDRLTQAGLVERVKSDTDKRVVMARLTETGRTAGENAPELLQAGFLRAFRELQSWEQNMLIASLQRIAELMDAENLDASPFLDTGEINE
ncbi:transcriptional regulator [Maricaulis sp. W15]|uniref:MarR family transcriptional regulator n=1 Tax=Maricaulis maris TaxID=74318 RepID=A0A495D5K0_9PROT|nr:MULTISPECIES: MarR family transcriptional regulator [Maricaulis]OLF71350.1 transcriptional regulator [Maricaulis sp. W15]RKQ96092.1 MarR family transcriptional regulator [Maricaulis maris]